MTQLIQAKDISLEDLQIQFNLQSAAQKDFFNEWQENLPESTEPEKQQLARVQQNYFNLSMRRNFSEEAVKMVILSPLLDLAGFYQAPFSIQTEESVEITAKDEETIVKGTIDVLVVQQQLWVLVIESKSTRFDVLTALPQALEYMLDTPNEVRPTYGLLVNGREFVFIELTQKPIPTYTRSFALSLERGNELEKALGILKTIQKRILENTL
ncbi:MAG: type I restriction endonuclease [Leptolyngbyaceae cyanobacterium]